MSTYNQQILHVFSSNFYSGSVQYAKDVASIQKHNHENVHIITDMEISIEGISTIQLPISNRSIAQRIKNILFLIRYIKQHDITIIHAHSRAASWVSYYATKICNIPLVSTIHGKQVKTKDIYGEKIIGICENLMRDTAQKNKLLASKLIAIPNGITLDKSAYTTIKSSESILSIIGRFNGIKGIIISQFICEILPDLLERKPELNIQFIGNEWEKLPEEGKNVFDQLKRKYADRIKLFGFITNVHEEILKSSLIVGAGRVAIETLLLGKPLIAVGEACYHGLISPANINDAIDSNFGDIVATNDPFKLQKEHVISDIIQGLTSHQDTHPEIEEALKQYSINSVYSELKKVYQSAYIQKYTPQHIPILMYHKVPTRTLESKHRIFVTSKNFKKHLRLFKLRGLTSITFKEYDDYKTGKLDFRKFPKKPFILTFDDGYADNFTNALPFMKKYGFKGVIYLLGDFDKLVNFWDEGESIESIQLMTLDQKKAFVEANWEIGAHTMTHAHLTLLNDSEITTELSESKNNLETVLNTSVISFAYPYGDLDNRVKCLVKEVGFTFGVATDSGGMTIEEDEFQIFRVNVFPEDGWFQMYKKTSSWYRSYFKKKKGK